MTCLCIKFLCAEIQNQSMSPKARCGRSAMLTIFVQATNNIFAFCFNIINSPIFCVVRNQINKLTAETIKLLRKKYGMTIAAP